jgi:hypothetical protein
MQQRRANGPEAHTHALNAGIQALLDLRSTVTLAPAMHAALAAAHSPLLCSMRDTVFNAPALHALATRIGDVLDEEARTPCERRFLPFILTLPNRCVRERQAS